MKLRKQYQKLFKGEKRNNLIVNLKSDIIHMSTKWALSFLEAKAKEKKKKKKNWEEGHTFLKAC